MFTISSANMQIKSSLPLLLLSGLLCFLLFFHILSNNLLVLHLIKKSGDSFINRDLPLRMYSKDEIS